LNSDEYIVPALIVTNLAAGFGCAIPIALSLRKVAGRTERFFRHFAMLVGIYFVECVAFPAWMCTQVFTIGLAFVWGIVFGLWLRSRAPSREVLKQAVYISIYGCSPTASFCVLIPAVWLIRGGHILSAEEGIGFGIPDFLPWPLSTILGFFTALLVGTVASKTIITAGVVHFLIHRKERIAGNTCSKDLEID
jgi:hypothetical protein